MGKSNTGSTNVLPDNGVKMFVCMYKCLMSINSYQTSEYCLTKLAMGTPKLGTGAPKLGMGTPKLGMGTPKLGTGTRWITGTIVGYINMDSFCWQICENGHAKTERSLRSSTNNDVEKGHWKMRVFFLMQIEGRYN